MESVSLALSIVCVMLALASLVISIYTLICTKAQQLAARAEPVSHPVEVESAIRGLYTPGRELPPEESEIYDPEEHGSSFSETLGL